MVNDGILRLSSSLLGEIKKMNSNVEMGYIKEAYNNYKNTIEIYLHLESVLPKNHSIIKSAKKAIQGFKPIMENCMRKDSEVISMISEATKAEKEAKKVEMAAKKEELKKVKELKSKLKEDIRVVKAAYDGLNGSIATSIPDFKLSRYHIKEMILVCEEMKSKIDALIGAEPQAEDNSQDE